MSKSVRTCALRMPLMLLLSGLGVAGSAMADTTSTNPDRPTAGDKVIRNPGALQLPDGRWLVVATGGWGATDEIYIGNAAGDLPWSIVNKRLLNRRPAWASTSAYWAPAITQRADGKYVVFYSAEVAGTNERRCIGTGVSTSTNLAPEAIPSTQEYLFTAEDTPLVCYSGHGAADNPSNDPEFTDTNYKMIDPTPTWMDINNDGNRELFLTYKTSSDLADNRKHSTLRMVRLEEAHPERNVFSTFRSHQLTEWTSVSIEENPVIAQLGPNRYILFSSRGHFDGNCSDTGQYPYLTMYRISSTPWNWDTAPVRLPFPADFNSCGSGNGHVVQRANGDWVIFFNGKYRSPFNTPSTLDGWRAIPYGMYIGKLEVDGAPSVQFIYK